MILKTFKTTEQTSADALLSLGAHNIHYLPNGKPVADNCCISVTHSGDFVAVCKSDSPVGIDMEAVKARDFSKLLRRFFSKRELEYYEASPSPERFYELWTRKEAYAKMTGEGLKIIIGGLDTFALSGVSFSTEIADGYVLTVCEKKE